MTMTNRGTSQFKRGTCRWCEDKGTVYRDNELCEDCDRRIVKCAVCGTKEHSDSHCRHVFEDQEFEWQGAGTGWKPNDGVRAAFMRLLDRMPAGFVPDLRGAIRSGKFHTWLIAPMIGGGGLFELYGMPWEASRRYGDAIMRLGEESDADELHDGYRWLVSLYDSDTPAANKLTLTMLAEWQWNGRTLKPHNRNGE